MLEDDYRDNIHMLQYFWEEKGDISRYCDYDEAKLQEYLPHVWQAWTQYRLAIRTLTAALGGDPTVKLHYCDYNESKETKDD